MNKFRLFQLISIVQRQILTFFCHKKNINECEQQKRVMEQNGCKSLKCELVTI